MAVGIQPIKAANFGENEVYESAEELAAAINEKLAAEKITTDSGNTYNGDELIEARVEDGKIVNASEPSITAQCLRVPASNGHMAAVFMKFKGEAPSMEQIKADWAAFAGRAQELELPSAPKQFLHYFEEDNRPQTQLDRNTENGMAVCIGRLRPDTQYDYKFVCLSHNTLRGAAGGAVLLAELLCKKGYIDAK